MPIAVISDYDQSWPVRAQQLLAQVRMVLDGGADSESFRYEHIGSTAVPGLAAKPILDLQITMPSLPSLAELTELLAPTGFEPAHGARPHSPGVYAKSSFLAEIEPQMRRWARHQTRSSTYHSAGWPPQPPA